MRHQNSISSIREKFESENGNTLAKPIDNLKIAYEYLWHKNEIDKYIYNKEIVKYDDENFWSKVEQEEREDTQKNEEFVDDLLSNEYDRVEMAKKYGRDYIKNLKNYEYFRNQIIFEQGKKEAEK